jgi:hypothetical protein
MLPGNSVFLVSIECLVQGQATKRTQSLGFLPLKYYKNIKNKLNFFFKKKIYIYILNAKTNRTKAWSKQLVYLY